jgi:LPXTG-motif cell wall-anchored protein
MKRAPSTPLVARVGSLLLVVLAAVLLSASLAAAQGTSSPQGPAQGPTGAPVSLYPHLPKAIRQHGARRGGMRRRARAGPAPTGPRRLSTRPPASRVPGASGEGAEEPLTRSATARPLPATGEEVWLVALMGLGLLLAGVGLSLRTGTVLGRSSPWPG